MKKIDDYNIMKKKIKELENEINVCKIEKDIIVKNKDFFLLQSVTHRLDVPNLVFLS
jgi:hypothetical protein